MRNGSIASAGRPDAMKCCTCRLVASEQLPDTTACRPEAAGSALAADEGAMPKLAGSPIATPEPAVTSGIVGERRAEPQQVVVRDRIDDCDADALGLQLRDALARSPLRRARPRHGR